MSETDYYVEYLMQKIEPMLRSLLDEVSEIKRFVNELKTKQQQIVLKIGPET